MSDFENLEPHTARVVLTYLRPAMLLHNDAHPARAWQIIGKLASDCERSVKVAERWEQLQRQHAERQGRQMQLPFS